VFALYIAEYTEEALHQVKFPMYSVKQYTRLVWLPTNLGL
jgi:hypothetical protein